jgi:hypothetical protein
VRPVLPSALLRSCAPARSKIPLVAIRRSTAPQTAALIADLVGADAVRREAAAARLTIAGPRVVDPLLAALGGASGEARITILRVLERLAEPRALSALLSAVASQTMPEALTGVAAVRAMLRSPDQTSADAALGALTAVALDRTRPEALRVAALDALSDLGPGVVDSIREQLSDETADRVRRAAGLEGPVATDIEAGAARLEAARQGAPDDPDVLRQLLKDAGDSVALSTLHELVLVIRRHERTSAPPMLVRWESARAAAHVALARRGSRLALFDLRESLSEGATEPHPDMVAAVGVIGDASCLEPIALSLGRASPDGLRDDLLSAGRAIVAREGLTRRHAAIRQLLARHPEAAGLVAVSVKTARP